MFLWSSYLIWFLEHVFFLKKIEYLGINDGDRKIGEKKICMCTQPIIMTLHQGNKWAFELVVHNLTCKIYLFEYIHCMVFWG